ncbi:MAG: HAMP domain-containing histidine kinase [Lachnospiraceae bacterium]|nr:HAMP domain-containing histidine kinase [Lachnospiraceae bacterium]
MKIRYIAGIYTMLMLVLLLLFAKGMKETDYKAVDMVSMNETIKQIEEDFSQGEDRKSIEEKRKCEILFLTDEDYESSLNQAIQEGKLLLDYREQETIKGKIIFHIQGEKYQQLQKELFMTMIIICLVISIVVYALLGVVYISFVRPFHKLQKFSTEIAKGNLDIPLPMNRHNFFGAFTESFDLMREELKRARESEYAANRSKKELVAELSHDIKTPIATIKAVCEVIQVKEKNQDTLDKVEVIVNKAEMIDSLVSNMFHATLEELEVLKVEPEENSSLLVEEMIQEQKYYGEIILENHIPECLLYFDELRLKQVIDNLIHNAYKYAKTECYVNFSEQENGIEIQIRDKGMGMLEEEISLAAEKFYRGSNAKGKDGSGLGLYLAKNFMEGMEGGMEFYNEDGFVVRLFLKKI